jgi:hypothetical protein
VPATTNASHAPTSAARTVATHGAARRTQLGSRGTAGVGGVDAAITPRS